MRFPLNVGTWLGCFPRGPPLSEFVLIKLLPKQTQRQGAQLGNLFQRWSQESLVGGGEMSQGRRGSAQGGQQKLYAVQNLSQWGLHSSGLSAQWKSEEAELPVHQLQWHLLWPSGWCVQVERRVLPHKAAGICRKGPPVQKRVRDFSRGYKGCFRISRSSLKLNCFSWGECPPLTWRLEVQLPMG